MYRRMIIAALLLLPLVAFADQGSAKGKITINGKSKDLTYAYAWKDGANVTVLLSDVKVDEKMLGDHFALTDLARKDEMTGVQATITPKGEVTSSTFYTAAEDGYFDAVGMHKFEKKTQSATEIAGKLSTDKEHKFFKTTFSYSAEFHAPIGAAKKN